jgi:hypothetical protein
MSTYFGNRALDSEVFIDFSNNTFVLDYSLNNGNVFDSSYSVTKSSEFETSEYTTRKYWELSSAGFALFYTFFYKYMAALVTYLVNKNIITSNRVKLYHQSMMRDLFIIISGFHEETVTGYLGSAQKQFIIPTNVYIEYLLDGDYKKYITKISLTRRFVTTYRHGKFKEELQMGWLVTFDFSEIPVKGSLVIKYTG